MKNTPSLPPSNWKHIRPTKRQVAAQLLTFTQKHGVTQTAVAKIIGCSGAAVNSALHGKFGSFELYDSICWALGLSLSDLNTRGTTGRNVIPIERARLRAVA